jgi:hypothetical protein
MPIKDGFRWPSGKLPVANARVNNLQNVSSSTFQAAGLSLSDIEAYAEAELTPIESGDKIVGYYLPTDFAGATNEAFGIIDFPSLAGYEVYRAKLAAHPLHKQYVEKLERSGALLSIQRSLVQQGEEPQS